MFHVERIDMEHEIMIFGGGKVGLSLALALHKINWSIRIVERDLRRKDYIVARGIRSENVVSSIVGIRNEPEAIFICLPKDSAGDACTQIAEAFGQAEGRISVAHTCGSEGLGLLEPLSGKGYLLSAAHPYQTFYKDDPGLLKNVPWGILSESDSSAIEDAVRASGGLPVRLPSNTEKQKMQYHISAVFVSNFMNALISAAKKIAESAGIDASVFFPAILRQTLENNLQALGSGDFPLTGPVARGDTAEIKNHLSALADMPDMLDAYKALTRLTSALAVEKGMAPASAFAELFE